jgi:hypothetical protein
MRLLHRWADTQLRRDNQHLRSSLKSAMRLARSWRDQRDAYRDDAVRWRSIATDRANALAEMKKEQNQ